jgi:hypothetical protein
MPDGVDALVHPMKPAASNTLLHRSNGQTDLPQLSEGHYPELLLRNLGNQGVNRFPAGLKYAYTSHLRPVGGGWVGMRHMLHQG